MFIPIIFIFFNLSIFPFYTQFLLALLPPGSAVAFRILILILLFVSNLIFIRIVKDFPAMRKNNLRPYVFALIIFTIGSIAFCYLSYIEPYGMWDAWSTWNMKSRDFSLSFLEGLPFELSRAEWAHKDYPIFLPMQFAGIAVVFNGWSVFLPIIMNYFYFTLTFLMIFDFTSKKNFKVRLISYIVLTVFALLPGLVQQYRYQCADAPLATFLAFSYYFAYNFYEGLKSNQTKVRFWFNSRLPYFFAFLGFIVFILPDIKNEGLFMTLCALPFFIFIFKSHIKPGMVLYFLISSLIPILSLVYFKSSVVWDHDFPFHLESFITRIFTLSRYITITKTFIKLHIIQSFSIIIFMHVYLLLIKKPRSLTFFLPILLPFLIFNIFFLITPQNLDWHLHTAYYRVTLQLYPALILTFIYLSTKMERDIADTGQT